MTLLPRPWRESGWEYPGFGLSIVLTLFGSIFVGVEVALVTGSAALTLASVLAMGAAVVTAGGLLDMMVAVYSRDFVEVKEFTSHLPKLAFAPILWPPVIAYRVGRAAGDGLSWYWDESKRIETEKYLALLDADDTPRLPSGCNEWCSPATMSNIDYHDYDCTNPENPYVRND